MSCKLSDFIHQHHIVSYDPSFNTLAPLCKGKIDQGPDSQPDYHDKYHMNPTHNEQAVSVLQYFLSKPINTHLWRLYPPIYILVSNTSGALMVVGSGGGGRVIQPGSLHLLCLNSLGTLYTGDAV